MSKKILVVSLLVGVFLMISASVQAAGTLTAAETVANTARGTDDQLATFASTTPNETAVQSVDDITLTAITMGSTSSKSLVIDACTISFDAKAQDLDCTNNAANINTASSTTAVHQAANFSQMLFTNYTASASTTNTSAFRLTHKNAAIDSYVVINGPSLASAATSSVTVGNAAVAEVDDITLAGTVETGDIFTLGSASTTYTYTVLAGATTLRLIGDGLYSAFQNAAGSSTEGFTVSTTTGNKVRLTARTAGTGITSSSTATNYAGIAQVITFTPASVSSGDVFKMSINGRDYNYTAGDTVASVVAGLVTAASADPVATCTNTTTEVTCTAKTSGTAFTSYAGSVTATITTSNSSAGGGSVFAVPAKISTPTVLTRAWSYGKTGQEVKLLQEKLKTLGFIKKSQKTTTYFGVVTKAALINFQKAKKLKPYNGVLNVNTRALLNSL
jgi:hypothetical protein